MKKFQKEKVKKDHSKLNAFIVSGAIALVLATAVYGVLVATENKILGQYDKTTVYVAKENIVKGTPLTADMFEESLADTRLVPVTAIPYTENFDTRITEYYAECDIAGKSMLLNTYMSKTLDKADGDVKVGISVTSPTNLVNGLIRTSDFVDIYIIDYSLDAEEAIKGLSPVYTGVYVSEVFTSNGTPIKNDDKTSTAQRFNVLLSQENAEKLIGLMQTGNVFVVKSSR